MVHARLLSLLLVLLITGCSSRSVGTCLSCDATHAWHVQEGYFDCSTCGTELGRVDCPTCAKQVLVRAGGVKPIVCPDCTTDFQTVACMYCGGLVRFTDGRFPLACGHCEEFPFRDFRCRHCNVELRPPAEEGRATCPSCAGQALVRFCCDCNYPHSLEADVAYTCRICGHGATALEPVELIGTCPHCTTRFAWPDPGTYSCKACSRPLHVTPCAHCSAKYVHGVAGDFECEDCGGVTAVGSQP